MDVDAVRVQRHVRGSSFPLSSTVTNTRSISDLAQTCVVGQASAENRRNDRAIPLDLLDKPIQRGFEFVLNRLLCHHPPRQAAMILESPASQESTDG